MTGWISLYGWGALAAAGLLEMAWIRPTLPAEARGERRAALAFGLLLLAGGTALFVFGPK